MTATRQPVAARTAAGPGIAGPGIAGAGTAGAGIAGAGVEVRARRIGTPWWRHWRFWVPLVLLVLAGALASTVITRQSTGPLDPQSSSPAGSRALSVVLGHYGVSVSRTARLSDVSAVGPGESLLVTDPDAYTDAQLRRLGALRDGGAGRIVLVAPSARVLGALGVDAVPETVVGGSDGAQQPDCADAGARAAGAITFPDDTVLYRGTGGAGSASCYGGVLITGRVTLLGSPALLRNDQVGRDGVAALDVNALTGSRQLARVVWLLPGSDATAQSAPTFWQLFPSGVRRAALWLLGVGILVVLWRARRLGRVVTEPLPVVVRAAEVVEGHGRLYRRAGARDHAAAALRAATVARLREQLGLPRRVGTDELVRSVSLAADRDPYEVGAILAGPPPADDHDLLRLVHALDGLEAAAGLPVRVEVPTDRGAHG